jgi:hypothetical protein
MILIIFYYIELSIYIISDIILKEELIKNLINLYLLFI